MDRKDDSVLFLLQDIKEILYGLTMILLGGIMIVVTESGGFILFGGVFLLLYGAYHVWTGWTNHELIEKKDEPQKKEEQGGPHAL